MKTTLDDIPKVAELKANGGLCPICGYRYVNGQKYFFNNGVMHREYHRQHVPREDVRLSGFPDGDTKVDQCSSSWLHKLVYERARYLQQQEHYDFVQWNEERGIDN